MNEHKPSHTIEILVNGKSVTVPDREVNGLEIKQAAIAQGLNIQLDFLVFRDLSNGQQVAVKDDEPVRVHHKERFDILCNDDHS